MLLHETTRKRICRGAFVACCLVPTVLVVMAIGFYHRPWRALDQAQAMSQQLHAQVSFASCWQPRHGVTEFRTLELHDLRTDTLLLSADRVRVDRRGQQIAVVAGRLDLPGDDLASLTRLLETWIASTELLNIDLPSIDIQAKQVVLRHRPTRGSARKPEPNVLASGDVVKNAEATSPEASAYGSRRNTAEVFRESLELRSLHAHNRTGAEDENQNVCRFWLQADVVTGNQESPIRLPIRLIIERVTEGNLPLLRATLDTRSASLPGWVLHGLVPGETLFEAGNFSGVARAESDIHHTRGTLRGRLADFDLRQLLPDGSPHKLLGRASITWDQLAWQDHRIEVAEGILQAADGLVSRSLLQAAEQLLHCEPAGVTIERPSAHFDQLSCRFRLNTAGMTLWGECPVSERTDNGCLLSRQGKPLLLQPKYVELPSVQLVRLASPAADGWLPATQEAQRIARALPLPHAASSHQKNSVFTTKKN